MAKATKSTSMMEVEETIMEPKTVLRNKEIPVILLTLTEEEAKTLRGILSKVGGLSERRKHCNSIINALNDCGIQFNLEESLRMGDGTISLRK